MTQVHAYCGDIGTRKHCRHLDHAAAIPPR